MGSVAMPMTVDQMQLDFGTLSAKKIFTKTLKVEHTRPQRMQRRMMMQLFTSSKKSVGPIHEAHQQRKPLRLEVGK